jgi:hypothetical protein
MKAQNLGKIFITKLDCVRRQLETAVILWFHEGDPVSIHTLVAAAYQILYDLNKVCGGTPMMKDAKNIRPEYVKDFHRLFAKSENFFKHADRDPLKTLRFAPQTTQCLMLDAIAKYDELSYEERPLFRLYNFYMVFTKPRLFKSNDFMRRFSAEVAPDIPTGITKRKFFHDFLPLLTKIESPTCHPNKTD